MGHVGVPLPLLVSLSATAYPPLVLQDIPPLLGWLSSASPRQILPHAVHCQIFLKILEGGPAPF